MAAISISFPIFFNSDDFLISHRICCILLLFYLSNRLFFSYEKLHYSLMYIFIFFSSWIINKFLGIQRDNYETYRLEYGGSY